MIWELLIAGIVVASFLAAAGLWVLTAVRRVKRSQLRRSAFVSSALNNLNRLDLGNRGTEVVRYPSRRRW